MSKEPWLFNGSKFRLHSFCLASPTLASSSPVSPKHPARPHAPHSPVLDHAGEQEGELHSRQTHDAAQNSFDQNQVERVDSVINETSSQASSPCECGGPQGITAELPSHSDRNADDQEAGPLLTLRLGLTCYKDYLGTNWSRRVAELRRRGEVEFNDPLALLAQPLGVGGVLCTDDGQVVFIRRSQRVAEAGGLLDIPGGHPEPKVRRNEVSLM